MSVKYVNFEGHSVSSEWNDVLRAAVAAKVKFSLNSGHRTMAEQKHLFDLNMHKVGGQWVPKPGRPLTAFPSTTAPHIRDGRIDHALDIDPGSDAFIAFCAKHGLSVARTVKGEHWHLEAIGPERLAEVASKFRRLRGPQKPTKHKIPSARFLMADVSNHNPAVSMSEYKRAGHRVIGLKATEGVGFVDPKYHARVLNAHEAGLHVVHYHFARPDNHPTPDAEARFFVQTVRPFLKRGDRVALDLEVNMGNIPVNLDNYGRRFLRLVSLGLQLGRVHPWLYSYTAFMREHGVRAHDGARLWLADYSAPILGDRKLGRIWAHQFTNGALGPPPHTVEGIGHCDVSKLSRLALLGMHIR